MNSTINARPEATRYINATCVSFENLGIVDMGFGRKPMGRFIFESDELNDFGEKRRYSRLFHLHTHPKSAVSQAVKYWLDRSLAQEEEERGKVDWQSFVGKRAVLKLVPALTRDGRDFENITEIFGVEQDEANPTCEPDEAN